MPKEEEPLKSMVVVLRYVRFSMKYKYPKIREFVDVFEKIFPQGPSFTWKSEVSADGDIYYDEFEIYEFTVTYFYGIKTWYVKHRHKNLFVGSGDSCLNAVREFCQLELDYHSKQIEESQKILEALNWRF